MSADPGSDAPHPDAPHSDEPDRPVAKGAGGGDSRVIGHRLGIDIGGANLKYASTDGQVWVSEFPLWQRPERLSDQLVSDLRRFSPQMPLLATMTGELADCFLDREQGIRHIIDHLEDAADQLGFRPPQFYGVDGGFYSASEARGRQIALMEASNWHATASWVTRSLFDRGRLRGYPSGLLVDIGSTTTDLIPFDSSGVTTASRTDFDRLGEGSLVYVGGGRTPVCSIVDRLRRKGEDVPVMREVFATMDDVRVLLGFEPENSGDLQSADGRPRDRFHAANRMARMIGLDHRSVTVEAAREMAGQVHQRARELIAEACRRLKSRGRSDDEPLVILSGHADDLWPESTGFGEIESWGDWFGVDVSRCAPAFAVASLFDARRL